MLKYIDENREFSKSTVRFFSRFKVHWRSTAKLYIHRTKRRLVVIIIGIVLAVLFLVNYRWNETLAKSMPLICSNASALIDHSLDPLQGVNATEISKNPDEIHIFDTICSHMAARVLKPGNVVDIADVVGDFCQEVLDDDDYVTRYLNAVIAQNFDGDIMLLHDKLSVTFDITTEFEGLNLRQFAVLNAFSAMVFKHIGRADVLLDLPELDSILSAFESNSLYQERRAVYTIEFSGCSSTSIAYNQGRYGIYMIQNLAASIKRLTDEGLRVPPVIMYTFDKTCIEQVKKYPELTVFDARPLAYLFPWCQRDLDSSARILFTWELLKRNISVFNADADVVFLKPFPEKYMDADVTGAMYTSPGANIVNGQYASTDRYLNAHSFDNFGQWWWKSSTAGKKFFLEYMKYAVFPTRWYCDDQRVFAGFLNQPNTKAMIGMISCGQHSISTSSQGDIHLRILEPEGFPMAVLAMYGWLTENTVTLHMSTYGYWKVFGLRELGLWFLRDNATWSPNGGFPATQSFVRLEQSSASSQAKEREHLVHLIAYAMKFNLGFVMPSFNCQFTDASSVLSPSMERCSFDFHYNYDDLIKLNVPFIFENEVGKVFGKKKPKKTSDKLVTKEKIKRCNKCLFEVLADDIKQVEGLDESILKVHQYITPNPRIHGCC